MDDAPVVITLTPDELKRFGAEVAERAASLALERVGLRDDGAQRDIWTLRAFAWLLRMLATRAAVCLAIIAFGVVSLLCGATVKRWLGYGGG